MLQVARAAHAATQHEGGEGGLDVLNLGGTTSVLELRRKVRVGLRVGVGVGSSMCGRGCGCGQGVMVVGGGGGEGGRCSWGGM